MYTTLYYICHLCTYLALDEVIVRPLGLIPVAGHVGRPADQADHASQPEDDVL